ncbi:ATP-binding protein [Candidatus Sororendozoicomonas aggregata]|uniref:ATP-binding protein n=1 Tax=Candidatus Sororendozoicomonas aggregata TaxID=3073239 RepID=UPI002ED69DCF
MTQSGRHQQLKMEVDSSFSNTVIVAMAVRGICEMTLLTPVEVSRLELCLVEVLNNTIEHAYNNQPGNVVETLVDISDTAVSITVSDRGLALPAEILNESANHAEQMLNNPTLQSSGRGLFIVNSLMDFVHYETLSGKNSFSLGINIHGNE